MMQMWKAIVYKELRETLWIGATALVVFGFVVGAFTDAIPQSMYVRAVVTLDLAAREPVPFLNDGFPADFLILAALFAAALGIRQTLLESVGGTWLVLLNRPIRFERVVGLKLITGAAIYLVIAALPILWYGCWAAAPGTHASPFFWSMTWPTWSTWLSLVVIYLGAFLTGIRPGRWIGSRALPLAGAIYLVALIQAAPWGWPMSLAATPVVAVIFVCSILYVARTRDFS
jgi:hypothetical protein